MTREVTIRNKKVGDGHPPYVVFEAGATHEGFEEACTLIGMAYGARADAIKFQMVDPDRMRCRGLTVTFGVQGHEEPMTLPLDEVLRKRVLKNVEWIKLIEVAHAKGLAFFCTADFEDQAHFLVVEGCDSIKIGSGDVNHRRLIEYASMKHFNLLPDDRYPVQLDTGNATLGEIVRAVEWINQSWATPIVHHVPTGYPASPDSVNLNMITTLRAVFPEVPIGFSDHSLGHNMDVAAVALGTNLVEKTITWDRSRPMPEHVMSLEPDETGPFVTLIKAMPIFLGKPRGRPFHEIEEARRAKRRSAYLPEGGRAGQLVADLKIEYARPGGRGMAPDEELGGGWALLSDLEPGNWLKRDHVTGFFFHSSDPRIDL